MNNYNSPTSIGGYPFLQNAARWQSFASGDTAEVAINN
jgi:hypothetical protein